MLNNHYTKPPGYRTYIARGASRYRPFNGYIGPSIARYASNQSATLTFSAAPTNSSTMTVDDGPPQSSNNPARVFTFTYAGSPGAGVIPLVAGGGTAAQAATAAQVALSAQLTNWVVSNPSAGVLVLERQQPGVSAVVSRTDSTNIALSFSTAVSLTVHPGRFGKNYAFLPG